MFVQHKIIIISIMFKFNIKLICIGNKKALFHDTPKCKLETPTFF